MPKVAIEKNAPRFILDDYEGSSFELKRFHGKKNVLLVFNRGFM